MKKYVYYIVLFIILISCVSCKGHTITQYGVVQDVEYIEPHIITYNVSITTSNGQNITYPQAIKSSGCWKTHIHYEDSICVYEYRTNELHPGDYVVRKINIKH